jgi:hypothetical protein
MEPTNTQPAARVAADRVATFRTAFFMELFTANFLPRMASKKK